MALSAQAAAVNAQVDNLIVVWKAFTDSLSDDDTIYVAPVDQGDATINGDHRTTTAAGVGVSFTNKSAILHTDDGDTPIAVPAPEGWRPLFFKVTNPDEELS